MSSTNMASMPSGDQKSKKKKKSKKKGGNNAQATTPVEPQTPTEASQPKDGAESDDSDAEETTELSSTKTDVPEGKKILDLMNGVAKDTPTPTEKNNDANADADTDTDTATRFDALVKDRDALRLEVTELRKSLEELQSKHATELETAQNDLAEAQQEKETAEEQYQTLLGRVNTIRSQLGERLKADAEELSQARERIDELESENKTLQERYDSRTAEVEELSSRNATLEASNAEQSKELSTLRNRLTLSQQNWHKEKEELVESEAYIREEFENAKQAMHDWEVLAMEERTLRRDLTDRTADLEEQLASLREAYEKATSERDTQSSTVDGLQKALQEIQTVRKQELKELVETNQAEQDSLRTQLSSLQAQQESMSAELETTKRDLERALPFEKEVKEKNLLIGKLRHEAVILNDHLTKALRFLKKGKPEDNVDRQIVTNHFLHFLHLDRSDPKKFQVLQLIAALLGWTDEQREQAGLTRPGGAGSTSTSNSLRLPGSPLVHRTPSTPALQQHHDYFGADSGVPTSPAAGAASRETLAELWQDFLEREANVNGGSTVSSTNAGRQGRSSRQASQSQSQNPKSPPPPPTTTTS
ncbi:uncharacterized protein PV06_02088 [Exophiala oligosperma]|uniref:GRIP domain-containing protein n=1 Tax=Exophiala oligosperma TaxID=215243 RepID=A0A0D2B2K3_9EURO|nr:uncharacterized protein PV06_02088 [Exophiala oligosperma]KIW46416.1 hypothetical protein PV06_02088 [Exophiala oligosperma]